MCVGAQFGSEGGKSSSCVTVYPSCKLHALPPLSVNAATVHEEKQELHTKTFCFQLGKNSLKLTVINSVVEFKTGLGFGLRRRFLEYNTCYYEKSTLCGTKHFYIFRYRDGY